MLYEQFRNPGLLEKCARARAGRLRQAQERGQVDRMVDVHGDARLADHRRLDAAAPRRLEVREIAVVAEPERDGIGW